MPAGKLTDTLNGVELCKRHLKSNFLLISVGDQTTFNLLENQVTPQISIVDGLTKRVEFEPDKFKKIQENYSKINLCSNPQSMLNQLAIDSIKNSIENYLKDKSKTLIVINGEEDLLFIPSVMFAPIGSLIVYGQPNEGMVLCLVDETLKEKMTNLFIDAFEEKTD